MSMAKKPAARVSAPSRIAGNRDRRQPVELGRALVEAFLTNERINQVLLDSLSPAVWRAQPPCSKRRNIATTFAHMHNVRCMRLKMSARDEELPAKLDRAEVTAAEAKEALAQSARAMVRLIEQSLANGGHVSDYRPDVVAFRVRGHHARRAPPRADLSLGQPTGRTVNIEATAGDVGVG
jgi:hypothetical protein